ncbi:hypothetical protein D3C86_1964120 [compost metagenome]
MRSFLPLTVLYTVSPLVNTPEYTRTKVSWPTNGSVISLNAKAENFSPSSALRVTGASSSSVPVTSGMSTGDGR